MTVNEPTNEPFEADVVEKPVEEEPHARGDGVSTMSYFISLCGYAIGLGNLWRFPYLVGQWGGGSFLLAYIVCLCFVASPMFLLELHWGQYTRFNAIECFRVMHPRWIGIGTSTVIMIIFLSMYYNLLLAYSCVYIIGSFYSPLPWTEDALGNTGNISASEYYFKHKVLNRYETVDLKDNNIDGPGNPQWRLVLGLLFVWVVVFFALFKGMEASAKVSYVTVGLPVICLFIMLIRAVTLEGASDGVEFYIGKFDAEELLKPRMWATACGQILFSLSPGMGTAITLSSYSKPTEDVYRVNYAVTLCNSCFSIIGGFAVFSILGYMSHRSCLEDNDLQCQTVEELAKKSGTGLAFVTLAEGVSQFGDGSNVFAFMFFVMLLTLGLDTTFAWGETLITYMRDYSVSKGKPISKEVCTAIICVWCFVTGLPFSTRVGFFLLDVTDRFAASYAMVFVVFVESVVLWCDWSWELIVEGIKEATTGDEFPEGRDIWVGWKYAMFYTAPVISGCLFWYLLIDDLRYPYGSYPVWLQVLGWCVIGIVLTPTVFFFIRNFNRTAKPLPGKRTKHHDLRPDAEAPKQLSDEPIAESVQEEPQNEQHEQTADQPEV